MQLKFYTPDCFADGESFGAATFGFVGSEDPAVPAAVEAPQELRGFAVSGTYAHCLASIPDGAWQAGIVLLGNKGGENAFVRALAEKTHAPLTGGAAAFRAPEHAGLITGRGQAAVFLIADERYDCEVLCENIHHDILETCTLSFTDPRVIDRINGEDALTWLQARKARLGLAPEDFEHLTLTDSHGINAHLSRQGGNLLSGRDVAAQMTLRYVPADQVLPRMRAFYDDADAVIFGCAGLKGILPGTLNTPGTGLFMFGEVCTAGGVSEFGNLMLSKLRLRRR